MVVLHSTTVKCFAKIRNLDNVNLQTSNCKLQFTVSQVKPDAKGLYCLHCAGIQWSFDHFLLAQEDVETLRGQYVSRVMDI